MVVTRAGGEETVSYWSVSWEDLSFLEMDGGDVLVYLQQGEYTWCHWTIHSEMVKMINCMLCVLYHVSYIFK